VGFSSDIEILTLFGFVEEVPLSRKDIQRYFDKSLLEDQVDPETGEIVARKGQLFDEGTLKLLRKHRIRRVNFLHLKKKDPIYDIIHNTLAKDRANNEQEALELIYQEIRGTARSGNRQTTPGTPLLR